MGRDEGVEGWKREDKGEMEGRGEEGSLGSRGVGWEPGEEEWRGLCDPSCLYRLQDFRTHGSDVRFTLEEEKKN